jgi:FkbM family methyltransferase
MQERLSYEYMRRFPIMVPRWLYPKLREFCFSRHKMPLCDYIKMQPLREFSEFNVLGAYAFIHHKDKFFWVDTTITAFGPQMPEPFAKQFFSWGGITPDIKKELEDILKGGDATCKATPVDSSDSQSSGAEKVQPSSAPPPGIRELPNGIWVLADDTHISKWVEEEGRLDHDQNFLPSILPYIKKGDTVVDAGAFIGDHTVAYLKAVGAEGKVIAFEPNPIAYECLKRNVGCLSNGSNLEVYPIALGEGANMAPLSGNNNNSGGCYLGEHMKIANVMVRALDSYHLTPGFIKLDVEGCEVNALYGAEKTIRRTYPIMVIEVNEVALQRQGDKPSQIYEFLDKVGYTYKVIQENCKWTDPLYDILCLPERPPEETTAASSIAARPPVAAIESVEDMRKCVDMLREFADISLHNKMLVMQRLVYRELKKPNPKKKKK